MARAAIWSASRVAGRSLWLRVTVVKSEKRTLMVTVRASSIFRSNQSAPLRAIRSSSARIVSRSVRSSG